MTERERWFFNFNSRTRTVEMRARATGPGGIVGDAYSELRAGQRSPIPGLDYRRLAAMKAGSFSIVGGCAEFDQPVPLAKSRQRRFIETGIGLIVVGKDGRERGVITKRGIKRRLARKRGQR
jgi:hypothetical protein